MSKGIVRLNDYSAGHSGFPARPSITSSTKCFADGKGIHRLTDNWATHCNITCHTGTATSCSSKTFADKKGICRTTDSISCGDSMKQCSTKCFTV